MMYLYRIMYLPKNGSVMKYLNVTAENEASAKEIFLMLYPEAEIYRCTPKVIL